MVRYKDYMEALYEALNGIAGATYLKDRPQAVSDKVNDFIVVDVSSYVNNKEIDQSGGFDYYTGQVYISIFVRDKVNSKRFQTININRLDELIKAVFAKFPIKDTERSFMAKKPRILVSTSDEDGWHYSLISASFTTYI